MKENDEGIKEQRKSLKEKKFIKKQISSGKKNKERQGK